MSGIRLLVDALVVASVAAAFAIRPRALARRPATTGGRLANPAVWLALLTGLLYLNQVLFTVYVLREHGGDPGFVARHLPAGWFDLATENPVLRSLADRFPAPWLLAPTALRVQAFLELPFVLLMFMTVVRWLDADLYRRVAASALLPLAAVSYTTVFCLVEWDLHNPYTTDDIVIRAASALVTPLLLRHLARRDTSTARLPATVPGLLLLIARLGALGVLVLVVYDTALLYNLGRLDDRLPLALTATATLLALHAATPRLRPARTPTPLLSFVLGTLTHWLPLFFLPALAIRYGLLFGTPALSLSAGALTAALALLRSAREAPPNTHSSTTLRAGLACATLTGAATAAMAVRLTPPSYEEAALLSGLLAFLVAGVGVCGLIDRRLGTTRNQGRSCAPGTGG
ncbi:hypothetical protein ACIBI4_09235 [Streptomyces sp. NPDC050418]|uniref:hypothetical protein n=1 Tax=Streptomyces sp. NPDC050418 TaxID=3365612 RepID=UPI0037A9356A